MAISSQDMIAKSEGYMQTQNVTQNADWNDVENAFIDGYRQAESDVMIVWVVAEGNSCEGRSIRGVFSTKENAMDYMRTHKLDFCDDWQLSECKLDKCEIIRNYYDEF